MNQFLSKVSLALHTKILVANIMDSYEGDAEYAFYLFHNDVRISTQWYSKNSTVHFDTEGIPGYYRVLGYLKTMDGRYESGKSNPVFANPVVVTADDFPNADPVKMTYEFKGNHWSFPVLYYPNKEKFLYVMLTAAVNRKKMVLPVFNRWTWAQKGLFPGEILCIADPTIGQHDELNLGWYIGNQLHDPIDALANFITKFADSKEIDNKNIVIWGSSAGGFAALALSAKIEGSIAVAINAQTDALSYHIPGQVKLIREVCFGDLPESDIRSRFPLRVDMSKTWEAVQNSRVVLIQNILDEHHYMDHFLPFWASLGGSGNTEGWFSAGRHAAWIYRDIGGHASETEKMATQIIRHINTNFF